MKSFVLTFLILLSIAACSTNTNADFIDQVLDVVIENPKDEYIQFPELYEKLTAEIADDKEEKLILVERLKSRGFEVINWGRGNYPPLGPRIVNIIMKKKNCECTVSKIYYSTVNENQYQLVEGISCRYK